MREKQPKRVLLNDRQCHVFVKALIEFGYEKVTFEEVRKIADQVAEGSHSRTHPYAILMCNQIDEAQAMRKISGKGELPVGKSTS